MRLKDLRYFDGTKVAGPHSYKVTGATVHYQIVSRWLSTGRSHTVRCGVSSTMGGTHEEGIEISAIDRLSAILGSSLGVEGLASLKSEIESVIEKQVGWHAKRTNTDTYNIPAPECGCQTWLLVQLVRDYRFTIETPRRFRRPRIENTDIHEKTDHYDLLLDDDTEDVNCPCGKRSGTDANEVLALRTGNLGIRVDANLTPDGQYEFRIGPQQYSVSAAAVSRAPTMIALVSIPDIVRQLSGIQEHDVVAEVQIAPQFDRVDLLSIEDSITTKSGEMPTSYGTEEEAN